MKPDELRIGNWILTSLPGGIKGLMIPSVQTQVQGITLFGEVIVCHTPQIEGFYMPVKHTMGIPLTEEWLLKFGYTIEEKFIAWGRVTKIKHVSISPELHLCYSEGGGEKEEGWYMKFLGEDAGSPEDMGLPRFEYVHRFQNFIFEATGEELTIKDLTK